MQYRSLFTAIPVDEACDNIHKNLLKDKTLSSRTSLDSSDIISLLNFVLSNNCFVYDDKIHCIQTDPRAAFNMLGNIWKSKEIRTETKLRIFNSNIKSVLLYGSETWRRTKKALQKIQTFINSCPRRILNIWWPVKIRNEELWQGGDQEPVGRQMLKRKWGWIGYTLRKEASNITRQSLTWNPQGKRRGRPENSWRRDTDTELRMMAYTWKEVVRTAQVRVRWRAVVNGLCSTWSDGPK